MKRVFAVMLLATACLIPSTPSFALGGVVHLLAHRAVGHELGGGFAQSIHCPASIAAEPQCRNRIPAALAAPYRHAS
jgi:hypothetical protein